MNQNMVTVQKTV